MGVSNHPDQFGTAPSCSTITRRIWAPGRPESRHSLVANEFGKRGLRANSISPAYNRNAHDPDSKHVPAFEWFPGTLPTGRIGTARTLPALPVWLPAMNAI